MTKVIKVNHAVLTLKIAPAGAGMTREEIDTLVNRRLAEGYDTVEIFPMKTNFSERNEPTDFVFAYIFKKFADEVLEPVQYGEGSTEGTHRGPGRPKKADA